MMIFYSKIFTKNFIFRNFLFLALHFLVCHAIITFLRKKIRGTSSFSLSVGVCFAFFFFFFFFFLFVGDMVVSDLLSCKLHNVQRKSNLARIVKPNACVTLNFNSGIQAALGLSLLRGETEVELCKTPMIELFCS